MSNQFVVDEISKSLQSAIKLTPYDSKWTDEMCARYVNGTPSLDVFLTEQLFPILLMKAGAAAASGTTGSGGSGGSGGASNVGHLTMANSQRQSSLPRTFQIQTKQRSHHFRLIFLRGWMRMQPI